MWLEVIRAKYRIGPFAVFDTLGSLIIAAIVAPLLSWLALKAGFRVPYFNWLWFTVPLAELVHILVGQETPLSKMLLNPSGDWIAKLVFIFMIFMSFRGIHHV